jgi:hypothetical protein
MVTLEQAQKIKNQIKEMPQLKFPVVNGIGITKRGDDYAVKVNIVGEELDFNCPTRIDNVEIVFEYNCGIPKFYEAEGE